MNKFYLVILSIFILLSSCNENDKSVNMSFDDIEYINTFPKSYYLKNGEVLDLNIIGVQSLSVQDSILIISTLNNDGYWTFFKIPEYQYLGKYITKGKGNNELLSSPRVAMQHFVKHNKQLLSIIYDFNTGKVFKMDISKTIQNKELIMSQINCELSPHLFNFVVLDSLYFFCREVDDDYMKQLRFTSKNGEKNTSKNMDILNCATIKRGADCNILGTFIKCNQEKHMIVEAAMNLNQINLYSIDDLFQKTICVKGQIDKISDIQNLEKKNKKVVYKHLAAYEDYFCALYQNDTYENIYNGKPKSQVIQFFDWNGKPLIEVILDDMINSYDIDFVNKCLYTLNYNTDKICIYDFKEVLEYLK